MGCDIYSFAEVKRKNKWTKVEEHFELDDYDKNLLKKEKGDNPFTNRSYSLFAFLADVRNYDKCKPISKPKGLPCDIGDEVKHEYNIYSEIYSCS